MRNTVAALVCVVVGLAAPWLCLKYVERAARKIREESELRRAAQRWGK